MITTLIRLTIVLLLSVCTTFMVTAQISQSKKAELVNKWLDLAYEFENENLDSAAHYYQMAGELAERLNDYDGKMRFAFGYSIVLNAKSRFSESEKILRQALVTAHKNEDDLNIAKALVNVGNVFNFKGLYDSAYLYYVEAIPFLQKADATNFLDILYSNIGILLQNLDRDEEALSYLDKGFAVAKSLNDSTRMATVLNNKGITLNGLQKPQEAIPIFNHAAGLAIGDRRVLASVYSNLANAYQLTNQNQQALQNYRRAAQIFEKLGDDDARGRALMGYAIVYFNLNNATLAEKYAEEATILISVRSSSRLDLYKLLADVKHQLGKYAASRDYFLKYIDLQKELQSQEIQETISNAEKKYQLAQKEEELAVKELQLTKSELENRKKSFYLIITTVLILTLGLISFLFLRNIRQRNKLFIIMPMPTRC